MLQWQGKSKGPASGYRLFVWVLKKFGVLPAYFLLKIVVVYFFIAHVKPSRQLYSLYNKRLGFSRFQSIINIYKNYFFLGQSIIDKVVITAGIKNKYSFNFDGEENLHEIARQKKGGMLLSAHIGNWDIAGLLLKRLDTRIHIVMYDGEKEKIKEYLGKLSVEKSINIIVIKEDLSHIYEISDAFKNNELVCMHADRFLDGNKTISTDFLGQPARFAKGPFVLAATFKVPVSFVFAVKESKFHYHFFASKIKEYGAIKKEDLMQQMLSDYAGEMEIKLKKYPLQWFNYYNFWH